MPERPPDRDDPEFNWLYGGDQAAGRPSSSAPGGAGAGAGQAPPPAWDDEPRVRPAPPSDDPEPTRMIKAMPRPAPDARGSGGGRGGTTTAPPPPRPAPSARPPRRQRGRTVRRVVVALLALWIVFLIAVPVWAWSQIDRVDATPRVTRPAEQPGTTYLLVGSDSRKGLSPEQRRKLGTGDAAGQRTDTIMLLHVGAGPNTLISIPRDSLVPIPGHGTTKINAAYAFGGPRLLVRTVEQNTGVRIDDYVEIGMGGVVNAVDAVGGVRICTPKRLDDKLANLHLAKGCHPDADGATALAFTRSRHSQQLGDIDRAKNQRAIVSQVGDKVKSPMTVINPFRYLAVAKAGSTALTVGEGTSPFALFRFAWAMSHLDGDSGRTCSMPIRDLAVHWDRDRALALMKLVKEDRTDQIPARLCTPSGLA